VRSRPWLYIAAPILVLVLTLPSVAQRTGNGSPSLSPAQTTPPVPGNVNPPLMSDGDEARTRLESDLAKKAAKERVAALKSDTDKLLKLSVELKSFVDKSDENVLSLDVIKKADEIEKLAKSVKEKMRGPN